MFPSPTVKHNVLPYIVETYMDMEAEKFPKMQIKKVFVLLFHELYRPKLNVIIFSCIFPPFFKQLEHSFLIGQDGVI